MRSVESNRRGTLYTYNSRMRISTYSINVFSSYFNEGGGWWYPTVSNFDNLIEHV